MIGRAGRELELLVIRWKQDSAGSAESLLAINEWSSGTLDHWNWPSVSAAQVWRLCVSWTEVMVDFWSDVSAALSLGNDEEAVVDRGKSSSAPYHSLQREELEGHRAMLVAVPQRRRGRRHHRRRRDIVDQEGQGSPHHCGSCLVTSDLPADSPSRRVLAILGAANTDQGHTPCQLFTQLDELTVGGGDSPEWKEAARWLKFEEDVEDGGERWSKPYVASLPLHSLLELRCCLQNAALLLDVSAATMEEVADLLTDALLAEGQLEAGLQEKVKVALLRQHHHQSEKRLSSRIPLVRSIADVGKKRCDHQQHGGQNLQTGASRENSWLDLSKVDTNFLKKIPAGAEASNVLVGQVDFLEQPITAFLRLSPAALLSGLTEVPVPTRFVFLLLRPSPVSGPGPEPRPEPDLQCREVGRCMATLMSDEIFHQVAYVAKSRADLLSGIDEFLDQVTVLPPGEWDPSIRIEPPKSVPSQDKRKGSAYIVEETEHHIGPELRRTGRLFGGLMKDVGRKVPFLWSDIRDGFSLQCLASVLFLYCACMSPVITFGGLLGEATRGNISAIESLLGASLTGVAFSLFGGQPLIILGSTGPVLVFEKILFQFCSSYSLSYLSLRASIGLWTAFFCLLLVAADASTLVCYITRFTEEAFAALICIIFIYEALEKLVHLGRVYPVNMHNHLDNLTFYRCRCSPPANISAEALQVWNQMNLTSENISWEQLSVKDCVHLHGGFVGPACSQRGTFVPDVLLWSTLLFFTTFLLSSALKHFKTKRYFPTKVRSTISDFAVFLTVLLMVLLDFLVGIQSPKLCVPERFEPTSSSRGWIISPLGRNPWWTLPAAAMPAALCTILIFMDQQITAVIVNRKENKLKKGCGYHLDLLVVAVMLAVCSIMGLPWFVAATVLSISHVNSLKVASESAAPGEQPLFLGIREQRVTGFMIFTLMGCSVFLTSALKLIPMPVLYGVFLFMGVSSLNGIQLFDRIKLLAMPSKHQPDLIYLRYVPLWKVHVFTAVQLLCLVALWSIKASAAAVVFPMMVLALVFIRKLLDLCFTKKELTWLDDLIPESKKKKKMEKLMLKDNESSLKSGGCVQVDVDDVGGVTEETFL
ncbi:sodium bicarbonate cotransporter 3-like isoform X3 [Nelusetta ayraudi]|uniref:sodium bicarbonate cotransporter 3-like isoform X3 n=1 Tax=Nelusetta ayraudi TaxID=303726 RepID=UPI003F727B21